MGTALIFGVPEVLGNHANNVLFDGKRVDKWWKDTRKAREKSNAEAKLRQEKLRAEEARRSNLNK